MSDSGTYFDKIIHGDCFDIMPLLPDNSVDMILTDPPYGFTNCKWDCCFPLDALWEQYNRILKPNGAAVIFAAQPFTARLITSNIRQFRYVWYWLKPYATGFAFAKFQPMRKVEDICVFYRKMPTYNPQGLREIIDAKPKTRNATADSIYKSATLAKAYTPKYTGYPTNVLEFNSDVKSNKNRLHPTQKPLALCEYLIRTYTGEGDVVLDNCCGSGTTAVAAKRCGRHYIAIEADEVYFERATQRIEEITI